MLEEEKLRKVSFLYLELEVNVINVENLDISQDNVEATDMVKLL
jgi:hypothetical protein